MSYNDGYTEELARRRAENTAPAGSSLRARIAMAALLPALWLAYDYATKPAWSFSKPAFEQFLQNSRSDTTLSHAVGRCVVNMVGQVGTVLNVESESMVLIGFQQGVALRHRASTLRPAACPSAS